MVRYTGRLDITIAVDWDLKPETKQKTAYCHMDESFQNHSLISPEFGRI